MFISCKESRIENNRNFYGCFYIGPFNDVQSLTIANALRRTLLSDCPGLGITSITIANVKHEYSTLNGVRESVLDIILNMKEIVLKKKIQSSHYYKKNSLSNLYTQISHSILKPSIGYLKVKGPGVIRAKDLRLPPLIECIDPDQYIATLADDGSLCMQFVIMEGRGYLTQKTPEQYDDKKFLKNRQLLLNKFKNISYNTNNLYFSNESHSNTPSAPFPSTISKKNNGEVQESKQKWNTFKC